MVVATLLEHFLCNVVDSIGFVTAVVCKAHIKPKPSENLILSGFFVPIREASENGKF